MDRRETLLALGAMTLIGVAAAAERDPAHKPPPFAMLIQPASDCVVNGQTCLSHSIYLVGEGRKEMAGVARNVNEMLALCAAVQSLAIQHGRQLGGLVPLAVAAAEATEAECRKHAEHEAPCKACADACAAFVRAGKQFQVEFAAWQQPIAGSAKKS